MRIGIDARFLTLPQEGGFKTYTENIVHGLAALDHQNEYILYTDRPGVGRSQESGVRIQGERDNFSVKVVAGQAAIREQVMLPLAMLRDRVDVAHFPCNTAPVAGRLRTVVTVHDLIPCLPDLKIRCGKGMKNRALASYWRKIIPAAARRAERIITISQSSKADIERIIGVPEQKITVIPTGLHADFRRVEDPEDRHEVRGKYKLPDRFLLGFVSSDPRKNSGRLLEAARLAIQNMPDLGLVLICASHEARALVLDFAHLRHPRFTKLSLLEKVPRKDLVTIYNMAQALVFPSLYEGFGLPVIEAMACGAPVVTSNVSSLPEVAGDAAVLIDPKDPCAIADGITSVVTDMALRSRLIERGMARAASFSWERTVRETIDVYEMVLAGETVAVRAEAAGGRAG